ncbi:hypothetical protein [Caballeronia sp. dw_276]|uniref:hypothetical protein n=1 Tax=Caballeronia sp. dw_276 TaxID=2719795 RepID=UPI001BD47EA5|nr:hypothetical protein [Caballeronia sp. dw_276]
MTAFLPNQQWIAEAETAIRGVDPAAAAVVSAIRTFALPELGIESVLLAELADGSEWRIEAQSLRPVTADEIAERNRARESFL